MSKSYWLPWTRIWSFLTIYTNAIQVGVISISSLAPSPLPHQVFFLMVIRNSQTGHKPIILWLKNPPVPSILLRVLPKLLTRHSTHYAALCDLFSCHLLDFASCCSSCCFLCPTFSGPLLVSANTEHAPGPQVFSFAISFACNSLIPHHLQLLTHLFGEVFSDYPFTTALQPPLSPSQHTPYFSSPFCFWHSTYRHTYTLFPPF